MIYAFVVNLCFSMSNKTPSNKPVFDDANTNAAMTVGFHLVANNDSFNRGNSSLNWSIQQADHETNR